jgi:signal transduction histidine kinase
MKKFIVCILLLLISIILPKIKAQNNDSLINVIKTSNVDTIKINALLELGSNMRFVYPDSAYEFARQAESLSIELNLFSKIAKAQNIYGSYYWVKGDMNKAIRFFHKAYTFYKKGGTIQKLGGSLFNIALAFNSINKKDSVFHYIDKAKVESLKYGDTATYFNAIGLQIPIYTEMGEFDKAIELGLESLRNAEETKNDLLIYYAYSNLGATYYKIGDYKKTEEYHLKALEYAKQSENVFDEAGATGNLALLYSTIKDYDKAFYYYKRSQKINETFQNPTQYIVNGVNIAVLYNNTKNYDKAIETLVPVLEKAKAFGAEKFMPNIYLTLAYSYKGIKNLAKSELNVNQAIQWAHNTNKVKILTDAYQIKTFIDSTRGRYLNAIRYKDSAQKYIDSIGNTDVRNKIQELNTRYETEKKEHENDILKKNNEAKEILISKQNIIINTSIIVGILVLLLLIVIAVSRIRLQKRNKLIIQQSTALEQSLEEIQALSDFKNDMTQMLVHDLKNPLNALLNLPDKMDVSERKELLKYAAQKMHMLVVNILDVNKYEKANLPVVTEQFDLLEIWNHIRKQYAFVIQEKSLTIQEKIPPNTLVFADKGLFERIISNIISNAINHTKTNGEISITGVLKNEKTIRIEISDNGYGIEKSRLANIFDQYAQGEHKVAFSTGIGLSFCKRAVEAHGGTIGIESEAGKGTTVAFEIPIKQQTVKKESKTQNVFLSKEDKKKLKPLYEDLKNLGLNETSKFRKLFLEMEALEIESEGWLKALKDVFYQNNSESYNELIDQIQQK